MGVPLGEPGAAVPADQKETVDHVRISDLNYEYLIELFINQTWADGSLFPS